MNKVSKALPERGWLTLTTPHPKQWNGILFMAISAFSQSPLHLIPNQMKSRHGCMSWTSWHKRLRVKVRVLRRLILESVNQVENGLTQVCIWAFNKPENASICWHLEDCPQYEWWEMTLTCLLQTVLPAFSLIYILCHLIWITKHQHWWTPLLIWCHFTSCPCSIPLCIS